MATTYAERVEQKIAELEGRTMTWADSGGARAKDRPSLDQPPEAPATSLEPAHAVVLKQAQIAWVGALLEMNRQCLEAWPKLDPWQKRIMKKFVAGDPTLFQLATAIAKQLERCSSGKTLEDAMDAAAKVEEGASLYLKRIERRLARMLPPEGDQELLEYLIAGIRNRAPVGGLVPRMMKYLEKVLTQEQLAALRSEYEAVFDCEFPTGPAELPPASCFRGDLDPKPGSDSISKGESCSSLESPSSDSLASESPSSESPGWIRCRECRRFRPDKARPDDALGDCVGEPANGYRVQWPFVWQRCGGFENGLQGKG